MPWEDAAQLSHDNRRNEIAPMRRIKTWLENVKVWADALNLNLGYEKESHKKVKFETVKGTDKFPRKRDKNVQTSKKQVFFYFF